MELYVLKKLSEIGDSTEYDEFVEQVNRENRRLSDPKWYERLSLETSIWRFDVDSARDRQKLIGYTSIVIHISNLAQFVSSGDEEEGEIIDLYFKIESMYLPLTSSEWRIIKETVGEETSAVAKYLRRRFDSSSEWKIDGMEAQKWTDEDRQLFSEYYDHDKLKILIRKVVGMHANFLELNKEYLIFLRRTILCSTIREKMCLLPEIIEFDEEIARLDEPVFRIEGPCNPIIGIKCRGMGGCRMLSCTCHFSNTMDLEEEERKDDELGWFDKECTACSYPNENYRKCIRRPALKGGWIGCYCSFPCAFESADNKYEQQLLLQIYNQMKKIKIQV